MASLPLLLGVPADELPEAFRRLVGNPQGVFIPAGFGPVLPSLLRAGLAGLSALVFAMGVARGEGGLVLLWIYGGVAALCALAGARPAHRAWTILCERRALAVGRRRRGLHVFPDGLLLWDGARGSLIPRETVEDITSGVAGSGHRLGVRILVKTDSGVVSVQQPWIPISDAEPARLDALRAWLETGRLEPVPGSPVMPSARNVLLAHLVVWVVGFGVSATLVSAGIWLGWAIPSLVGLLLGIPLFLGFPLILERSVGRWLRRDTERPSGWGYFALLGLALCFLVILGTDGLGELCRHWLAEEHDDVTPAELMMADRPDFFRRPADLHVLVEPVGFHGHRQFLGDGSWSTTGVYVAPLAQAPFTEAGGAGCLWLGLETSDDYRSKRSIRRLIESRPEWLVPVSGLGASGFEDAVKDALSRLDSEHCPSDPKVLVGSLPRAEALARSARRLGLLHALAHGLPLLMLAIWAAWKLDRRPPGIRDFRGRAP